MAEDNNKKKVRWRYFIDKPFQIRFILKFLILILIGLALSLAFLAIQSERQYEENVYFQVKNINEIIPEDVTTTPSLDDIRDQQIISEYFEMAPKTPFDISLLPLIWMSILFIVLIIIFGLFISHKMAGPVYRIKKTLKEVSDGNIDVNEVKFRLRKRDELKDLVDALNEFLEKTVHSK